MVVSVSLARLLGAAQHYERPARPKPDGAKCLPITFCATLIAMSDEPAAWTIEHIAAALSVPELQQRFMNEIQRAPMHGILGVFVRWQRTAIDLEDAAQRGRSLLAQAGPDGELPGEWIDVTITKDDIRRWPASVHKVELVEGVLVYQGTWPFEDQDVEIAARVYPGAAIQIIGDVMKVSTKPFA